MGNSDMSKKYAYDKQAQKKNITKINETSKVTYDVSLKTQTTPLLVEATYTSLYKNHAKWHIV